MKRKVILVVAMLDSIHTARWLSQFQNQEIDFVIVGSKKHKRLHPNLMQLLKSRGEAQYELAHFRNSLGFAGYLDFFLDI
jgi:hypothetical protein